jgi:hypothetical protein
LSIIIEKAERQRSAFFCLGVTAVLAAFVIEVKAVEITSILIKR